MRLTATCITCSSVFHEQDEDGAPEIPGQKCADINCSTWICDAECSEHHSFVCECGERFCSEHMLQVYGMKLCIRCAAHEWNTCQECKRTIATHRLPDQMGLCDGCMANRKRETRGCPECPECAHRYWVERDGAQSWVARPSGKLVTHHDGIRFRCGCGLAFTREQAGAAREERRRAKEASQPPRRVLFAPPGYQQVERSVRG